MLFSPDQYRLLDFGEGRRLERFGPLIVDRPSPTADGLARGDPEAWQRADARFERTDREHGQWICRPDLPQRWTIRRAGLVLEAKLTAFGQVGMFPEQAENWDWIAQRVTQAGPKGTVPFSSDENRDSPRKQLRLLNLFAYTGASTLAAAGAGAEVVHVDAARNMVAWARRNAELSGLAAAPIRWIAEDALKFVRRELRRGSRYDAVVLDPPSYGHGAHGEVWRLSAHLPRLLALCAELAVGRPRFLLLSCHTPGFTPGRLHDLLLATLGGGNIQAQPLQLLTASGRELSAGVAARWEP
ncbi:MAG: class I SAM-dependent methyltransferase [Thermoguttaceae bacterium]